MYIPPDADHTKEFCDVIKNCDARCGLKFPTFDGYLKKGDWNHIKQRIIMNTPNKPDGKLEMWINGIKRIDFSQIIFRVYDHVQIRGFTITSFFGGDATFATKIDTYTLYKNFIFYDY